ncbi:MAG: DUF6249 domain-containing protein [Gammaproteobacteria bacterium]|nr:DUF6249 domain-containing protein [Gammaproteobacteria bacterium]
MSELMIPITLFISIAVVVVLGLYYRHRSRVEVQKSLRQAIEGGQQLTPEFLKLLGDPPRHPRADLRRGIVILALAAGFALFGLLLGEEDAVQPMLAVASFPGVIGVAYLLLWKFGGGQD